MPAVQATVGTQKLEATGQSYEGNDDGENSSESLDLAVSLMEESMAELSQANLDSVIFLFRQVLEQSEALHPPHFNALCGLASALGLRFMLNKEDKDMVEYHEFQELMKKQELPLTLPLSVDENTDTELLDLARSSLVEICRAVSLATINTIIFLVQQSLSVLPPDHPKQRLALKILAYGNLIEFIHAGSQSEGRSANSSSQLNTLDIHEDQVDALQRILDMVAGGRAFGLDSLPDVDSARRSAMSVPPSRKDTTGNVDEDMSLLAYAQDLVEKSDTSGDVDSLEHGISLMRLGLTEVPVKSRSYLIGLCDLANALINRFNRLGDAQDLDESVSLNKQLLEPTPLSYLGRSTTYNNLAIALSKRFERRGDRKDLEESISFHKQALDLERPPSAEYCRSLDGLATVLLIRFEHQGNASDLNESISLHRQALEVEDPLHPDHSTSLNNLANSLWTRFTQRGDLKDLDESISLHERALALRPVPHPKRISSLNNLAAALMTRFEHTSGRVQDLDKAISFCRQVLELSLPTHAFRFGSLNNLALALLNRFDVQGDIQDLDESISVHRRVLELLPPSHPHRMSSFSNLAMTLLTRFRQRNNLEDLDESVWFHRQAVIFQSPSHPKYSNSVNNLACALWRRFKARHDIQDLDESISLDMQALELRPLPHPRRSSTLNNLAVTLMTHFEITGDEQSLDNSILYHRQALELRPAPHMERSGTLNNLAAVLWTRFSHRYDTKDLDEAISCHEQALKLRPPSHPDHTSSLYNLAITLETRFETNGNLSHLEQAMALFSDAAHSRSHLPTARFRHARAWAQYADVHNHASAIEAFEVTLGLLPELAALDLDIQSRQELLTSGTDGLARKGAGCAIRIGNLAKAVELLETGRGVFWSQFLSLRSPFDRLDDVAPQLATDLRRISAELEEASHRDKTSSNHSNKQKLTMEEKAKLFEKLSTQWAESVENVREVEGFEDFLRPEKLSNLQNAAAEHPIVYLVSNVKASDCLVVTSAGIHHIPLRNLPAEVLSNLVNLVKMSSSEHENPGFDVGDQMETWKNFPPPVLNILQRVMSDDDSEERGMRQERRIPGHLSSDDIFRFVLRALWEEAVRPVIEHLGFKKTDKPQRLTWCTTGLFSFLPVHAAGRYEEGNVDCASDYIVSSYTPTIKALLTSNPLPTKPFRMMAVIDTQTLPRTREELRRIEGHVQQDLLTKFGTPEAQASAMAVASQLSSVSIVHFACHGKQDLANPLKSGLAVGGEMLTISRIMKESVPEGSLAFLGACETAMGDGKIPDEAMSIGASLLFAGFKSVVATMWRIWDSDGPIIADAFYRELFKGPDGNPMPFPDTSKSAEALAVAVKELRTRRVPFKRWVPFIHMGK